jgi:hypothetical protein
MRLSVLLLVGAIALVGACRSAPVHNITDTPVVVADGKTATMDNVKMAIVRAGTQLGWQMTHAAPGLINARIALRNHTASADIRFDTKTYSITYRDSTNLDDRDGTFTRTTTVGSRTSTGTSESSYC